jgi:hypothetical protein
VDLKEVRQWFYEIVGILIPGGISAFIVLLWAHDPTRFVSALPDLGAIEKTILPFGSGWLNAGLIVSACYSAGHLVQQLAIYLMEWHSRLFRLKQHNSIAETFKNTLIRTKAAPFAALANLGLSLEPNDLFMMIYPDFAPKTKRDTFIGAAAFCGAMAVVTMLFVLLSLTAGMLAVWDHLSIVPRIWIPVLALCMALTELWIQRARFYYDMADRIVVNYFLGHIDRAHIADEPIGGADDASG